MEIIKPNYKDGSIVNLMSTIGARFGYRSIYRNLALLSPKELKKNVILLVIDGLGFEYLNKFGQNSFLFSLLKDKMTSVFPPTTASAITSFYTGLAPQQHAITGWYVYFKEIGAVAMPLPYFARGAGEINASPEELLNLKPIFNKLKVKSYNIMPAHLIGSNYNKSQLKNVTSFGYRTLSGMFRQMNRALKKPHQKYIYSYWPMFDTICHEFGPDSVEAFAHFLELDNAVFRFAGKMPKNTTLIVTADHGLMQTTRKRIILKHKLNDFLVLPLSGEPRAAYCYLKSGKEKEFKQYVKKHLKMCKLLPSKQLVKDNMFGLGKPNPKLFDRIGDYTLILKENYIIKDTLLGEEEGTHIGHHGGVGKEEMYVPLLVYST